MLRTNFMWAHLRTSSSSTFIQIFWRSHNCPLSKLQQCAENWLIDPGGGRYHSLSSIHTMAYNAVENGHLRRVQMDCVKRSGIETNLTCCVFLMCNLEDYPNAFYAVNYAGLNEPLVTGKIFLLFKRPSLTCITPCYNALYLLLLKCSMD